MAMTINHDKKLAVKDVILCFATLFFRRKN